MKCDRCQLTGVRMWGNRDTCLCCDCAMLEARVVVEPHGPVNIGPFVPQYTSVDDWQKLPLRPSTDECEKCDSTSVHERGMCRRHYREWLVLEYAEDLYAVVHGGTKDGLMRLSALTDMCWSEEINPGELAPSHSEVTTVHRLDVLRRVYVHDAERLHREADAVVTGFLSAHGHNHLALAYKLIDRWYA